MKNTIPSLLAAAAMALSVTTARAETIGDNASREEAMKIRFIIDGAELTATLEDSAASRDFAAMLPMEVTLEDYHGIEKIHYLPDRLSTEGAPEGVDPEVGDITYYAPWGNLALFYQDFGYSRGLIRLGRFDAGVAPLAVRGSVDVRIEAIPAQPTPTEQ